VNPPLQPLLQARLKKCSIVVVAELAQVLAKEMQGQALALAWHAARMHHSSYGGGGGGQGF
jgi:hypothetical protein